MADMCPVSNIISDLRPKISELSKTLDNIDPSPLSEVYLRQFFDSFDSRREPGLANLLPLTARIEAALPSYDKNPPSFALYPDENWFGVYIAQCISYTHHAHLLENLLAGITMYSSPCYKLKLCVAESIKEWEFFEEGRCLFHSNWPMNKMINFGNPNAVYDLFREKLRLPHEQYTKISNFVGKTLQTLHISLWHKVISQEELDARFATFCDPRVPFSGNLEHPSATNALEPC